MHKKHQNEVPEYTFKLVSDSSGKPQIYEEDQENIKMNRQAESGSDDMFSFVPEMKEFISSVDHSQKYERQIKSGEYEF